MLRSKTAASIFAFLSLTMGTAQGADILDGTALSFKDTPGSYWIVTLGGYAGAQPEYPGAKTSAFAFRPIIDIRQEGSKEWLTLPNDAFSLTLYQAANFRIGAAGDYLLNRDHRNDSALRGLNDINYTGELGGFAEYYPAPFLRTRLELLQGISGADGLAANLMADFIYAPDPRWLFTAGPRLQFVNTQYESTFFSVTSGEALASGLSTYHASGGLNSAGIDATARYNVSDRLSLRAFAEWDRLVGDAADSPIVKVRGSEDQFQFGIGAAYKFTYGR
ncbi:MAG: MipA/OmpV family protein [Rhodomicrobium sp.]